MPLCVHQPSRVFRRCQVSLSVSLGTVSRASASCEGLEISLAAGTAFATRYFAPDRFVMTSGIGVPFDDDLLELVVDSTPLLLRKSPAQAIEDRRFAKAVYRAAITDGVMRGVTYQDPSDVGDAA